MSRRGAPFVLHHRGHVAPAGPVGHSIAPMREVVLDTETTGMSPSDGHRLVEVGAVELEGHIATGRSLQLYMNPQRTVPPEAVAVHGLTNAFLAEKPFFAQVYTDFLDFIGDARLVIHNAAFDMGFLNCELKAVGHPGLEASRVVDTLDMARRKFPGSPANLDALCRRFGIDATARDYHGALLDSQLLAEVYLELLGGRQHGLNLAQEDESGGEQGAGSAGGGLTPLQRPVRPARHHAPSAEELAAHTAMLAGIKGALWAHAA
jgi:DNA polymerase-3 subunit epsilon